MVNMLTWQRLFFKKKNLKLGHFVLDINTLKIIPNSLLLHFQIQTPNPYKLITFLSHLLPILLILICADLFFFLN